MTVAESLAAGICPNCWSNSIRVQPGHISCATCGINGDPGKIRWCEKVPLFRSVAKEDIWLTSGQLYKHEDRLFTLVGYMPGCGRVFEGEWCVSCRPFLPTPVERPSRKAKRKSGKDAATGEAEEEVAV
jgi:hypothetical protein